MTRDRLLLTLATLAFASIGYLLMLKGWRGRQRRQGDLPPPPAVPEDPGPVLVGAVAGLFVGTTSDQSWLDRIAVHGLSDRSAGWLTVHGSGVVIEREGVPDLYLPYDVLVQVGTADAVAGRMVGRDGLLALSWRLGGRTLISGFRADDHGVYPRVVDAVRAHLPLEAA